MAAKAEDMRSLQDIANKDSYKLASDARANFTVRSQTHPKQCEDTL